MKAYTPTKFQNSLPRKNYISLHNPKAPHPCLAARQGKMKGEAMMLAFLRSASAKILSYRSSSEPRHSSFKKSLSCVS